jgi:hypothetical protein
VVVEKIVDDKESLKITIKAPTLGGQAQAKIAEETVRQLEAPQLARPVHTIGQIGLAGGAPPIIPVPHTGQIGPQTPRQQRTFKPKSPEKGRWKSDEGGSQYNKYRAMPTFDLLLNKYTRQLVV